MMSDNEDEEYVDANENILNDDVDLNAIHAQIDENPDQEQPIIHAPIVDGIQPPLNDSGGDDDESDLEDADIENDVIGEVVDDESDVDEADIANGLIDQVVEYGYDDDEDEDNVGYFMGFEEREDSDSDVTDEAPDITYDKSLPGAHAYLGNDLEEVRGRTIHDDDTYLNLPILPLPNVVLVPGQTLPLHVFPSNTVAMIRTVVDRDKTFGIVTRYSIRGQGERLSKLGTTAEILAIKEEEDQSAGIANVKLKAIGRQRFEIKEMRRQTDGMLMCKVRILPEKILSDPLEGAELNSYRKLRVQDGGEETNCDTGGGDLAKRLSSALQCSQTKHRKYNKLWSANLTWWPPWVYKQYDAQSVMNLLKEELRGWNATLRPDTMPRDPVEFSFWVAGMLPLNDTMKLYLLSIDNATQRMRYELSLMQKCTVLSCSQCSLHIANKNDVFSLTLEGPMAAYVNPGGHVHETLTIYKTHGLNLIGRPSTDNSWFPGYAWTIAQCRNCHRHMGWKFTSAKKGLKPDKFWGITRSALQPGLKQAELDEMEGEQSLPVM